eukprot:TRINITY_DN7316_c0_g1_i1.p1 TRINITY_DN7316_c0_g1~~TRINITY_DN7316_c0_g1_i1.p1  ORF type:complete len:614 (+),score=109.03 TRINITY_DN7316_c0_g1_i1:51-1892(+)
MSEHDPIQEDEDDGPSSASGHCRESIDSIDSFRIGQMSPAGGPSVMSLTPKTSSRKRRSWTKEEDEKLIAAVRQFGLESWQKVSDSFGHSRTRDQCYQRWIRALKPGIKKGAWSEYEDRVLRDKVEQLGEGSWCEVARALEGRTDQQCRRHWTLLRAKDTQRGIIPQGSQFHDHSSQYFGTSASNPNTNTSTFTDPHSLSSSTHSSTLSKSSLTVHSNFLSPPNSMTSTSHLQDTSDGLSRLSLSATPIDSYFTQQYQPLFPASNGQQETFMWRPPHSVAPVIRNQPYPHPYSPHIRYKQPQYTHTSPSFDSGAMPSWSEFGLPHNSANPGPLKTSVRATYPDDNKRLLSPPNAQTTSHSSTSSPNTLSQQGEDPDIWQQNGLYLLDAAARGTLSPPSGPEAVRDSAGEPVFYRSSSVPIHSTSGSHAGVSKPNSRAIRNAPRPEIVKQKIEAPQLRPTSEHPLSATQLGDVDWDPLQDPLRRRSQKSKMTNPGQNEDEDMADGFVRVDAANITEEDVRAVTADWRQEGKRKPFSSLQFRRSPPKSIPPPQITSSTSAPNQNFLSNASGNISGLQYPEALEEKQRTSSSGSHGGGQDMANGSGWRISIKSLLN